MDRLALLALAIAKKGGGIGAVSSVNGQTGEVVLDAADVGAAEAFLVTVTRDDDTGYAADKTLNEINAAYFAGKELWATFPIPMLYNGFTIDFDVTAPLAPLSTNPGSALGYAAVVLTRNFGQTAIDHYQLSIFPNGVGVVQTTLTSGTTPQALGTASAGTSLELSRADHVHTMPTAADVGAVAEPNEVTVSDAGAVSQECADNTVYTFTGALTSLTLTQAVGAREYLVIFTTGSTAPTVTFPSGVAFPDALTIEANTRYEVSVRDGYAVAQAWEARL